MCENTKENKWLKSGKWGLTIVFLYKKEYGQPG